MNLKELLKGTGGKTKSKVETEFSGIATDSRLSTENKAFFALKGEAFDAHDYLADVVQQGVGAIVSHQWREEFEPLAKQITWVHVDDTLKALQDLSRFWRQNWAKMVIGVTGSNGKTSVKDFTAAILAEHKGVLKSQGSFNNHWGVPLTLLQLQAEHEVAVVEMGMNHPGEITQLCQIAEPNIALVNNIGRAHIGHFNSLEDVAKAKEEIYQGLQSDGQAVFNTSLQHTKEMYLRWKDKFSSVITFGDQTAHVFFEVLSMNEKGLNISGQIQGVEGQASVPIWGRHNCDNLMAAASLCLAAGLSPEQIWSSLPNCRTGWGRNQWVELSAGSPLLFDGYNANPDSFKALIENVEEACSDKKVIAVFGEMLEQGEARAEAHFLLGKQVAQSSIDHCLFIGPSGADFQEGFESLRENNKSLVISDTYKEDLALKIKSMLDTEVLVVVKGSRGGSLERLVKALDPINFEDK